MSPATDLDALRDKLKAATLTRERRWALQNELAASTTWAERAELDEILRRLPADETAEIRDLVFR